MVSTKYPRLAEKPAATRNHFRNARAHQANFQHIGFNDGADIEPVALRDPRVGDAPAAVLALADAGEAFVGFERIAAGGDKIDRGIEIGARERGVRRRRCHLGVKLITQERRAAGAAEHMLGEHVERADARGRRVLGISAIASSAARHSSTSKRLAGTSTPLDGSSMR